MNKPSLVPTPADANFESFGKKYLMPAFRIRIVIAISLACIGGLSLLGIAHAYKTKIVTVSLDPRIDVGEAIREIESLMNAKCVSEFRNLSSLNKPDKIDQIKIKMMTSQQSEEGVVARAIGHVWMTGSEEFQMVMIRLMDRGCLKVCRLYDSMCPPTHGTNVDIKRPATRSESESEDN